MTQVAKKLGILDCTIRDGGYLNNWNFDKELVREVYKSLSKAGVDFIEIGFRSSSKYFNPARYGHWRFTPEDAIVEVTKNISGASISLMVDYGKVDPEDIPDSSSSNVEMYRVACNKDSISSAVEFCDLISQRGYTVTIQLMGIVNYTKKELKSAVNVIKRSELDYIYFADSYGSLFPSDIKKILDNLSASGKKIGFHSHNNLQLAFANTLEAIKNGADIVDSTIFGMGRGAGNLPIEVLIAYLEKNSDHKKYNVLPILDLIDRYFHSLNEKLNWGYDLPFMLSGIFKLHPYYSKAMIDYREFSIDDIWKSLEIVKEINPIGFNKEIIEKLIKSGFVGSNFQTKTTPISYHGDIEKILKKDVLYINRHKGRDFLVLANGPSLKEYAVEVNKFIKKLNPIVLGANFLGDLFIPHYHAFSNRKRFIDYVKTVNENSNLLLSSSFPDKFIKEYIDRPYEVIVHSPELRDFEIKNGVILSNCRTVSVLLIATAIVMGSERIFIAGMDGYKGSREYATHFYNETEEATDYKILIEKHNWNELLLNQINKFRVKKNKEGLHIITPTNHKMFYKGINNYI
jgi:4-hydroxy 2-oxovalerate aldolase